MKHIWSKKKKHTQCVSPSSMKSFTNFFLYWTRKIFFVTTLFTGNIVNKTSKWICDENCPKWLRQKPKITVLLDPIETIKGQWLTMVPAGLLSIKPILVLVLMCVVKCRRVGSWDRLMGNFMHLSSTSAQFWSKEQRSRPASGRETGSSKCEYLKFLQFYLWMRGGHIGSHRIFPALFVVFYLATYSLPAVQRS